MTKDLTLDPADPTKTAVQCELTVDTIGQQSNRPWYWRLEAAASSTGRPRWYVENREWYPTEPAARAAAKAVAEELGIEVRE